MRQPGHETQSWAFDHVAGVDSTQEEIFQGKILAVSVTEDHD